jgi:alkylation response protein AidB-like acyl-CoA dehydrogenase
VDAEFSDEQEQLRAAVRRFLAQRAPLRPFVRSMLDDPTGTDGSVARGLAGLGVAGLLVAEEHGGAGMGMVDAAVVLEELGRALYPGPFASSAVGAATLLARAGGADARAAHLPGIADGSCPVALAVLEPAGRATWREPATTAGVTGLTGEKVAVLDGAAAATLLVTARDRDGVGVYAVAVTSPGVRVVPTAGLDPTRKLATVVLEGTPATRLGPGDHRDAIGVALDRLGVALAVDAVGAATRALELVTDHARERRQFGVPIGTFQAVQHLCADMLQAVELARAGAYYACWAADAAGPVEAHRAAKIAQAWASEELAELGGNAIQVFGGIGFTWEHDIHLFYKRLLSCALLLGTADDHLADLADSILPG